MPTYDQMQGQAWRALDRNQAVVEREIVANYRKAAVAIRAEMAKIYEKYAVDGVLSNAEMTKYNRLVGLEKQIIGDVQPAVAQSIRDITRLQGTQYNQGFFRNAWALDNSLGVRMRWGTFNPKQVAQAVANPLALISKQRLRENTLIQVRSAIAQGLIRGSSYPAMMRNIKPAINGSASDALRIARTEGQRAAVLGQQAQYADADDKGIEVQEIWDATLDDRTRPDHGALDGQAKDTKTNTWQTAVGPVTGPLQSGVASFDINCRCRVRGEVDDEQPAVRRIRGKGVVPYQTYDQWDKTRPK